jgi:hypothetical protein
MKKMNAAVVVIILMAAAYVTLMLTIGQANETVLIVWSKSVQYPLPFEVSPWWNILSFPLAIFAVIYLTNSDCFIGNEYSGAKANLSHNYQARLSVHIVTAISLIMTSGVYVLASWIDFLIPAADTIGGPLSILIIALVCLFGCYISFGVIMPFARILFIYHPDNEKMDLSEYYVSMLAKYTKIGILKTLPFIWGLTIGFVFRMIYEFVAIFVRFFKAIQLNLPDGL